MPHKPTLFTVLVVVAVLFLVYHLLTHKARKTTGGGK